RANEEFAMKNRARAFVLSTAAVAGLCGGALSRLHADSENLESAGAAAREAAVFAIPPSQTPTPPGKSERQRLVLRATSSQTGQPIKGVDVHFYGRIGGEPIRTSAATFGDGMVTLSWRKGFAVQNVWFTARAPGLVPIDYNWGDDHHTVELPEFVDLRFEPGLPIGGVVRDEEGNPIVGVQIQAQLPLTWPANSGLVFLANTSKTDAEGRWTWNEAPADCSQVKIQIDHPQYEHSWAKGVRSQQLVYVLKRRADGSPGSPNSVSSLKKP
ncbi:MAG TPA: Ig-like domain-containing protein, partial [Planctomycetaceae bacterium]|nr:Ig-like domain-containing protein [Planctomycetaceae bacterium]